MYLYDWIYGDGFECTDGNECEAVTNLCSTPEPTPRVVTNVHITLNILTTVKSVQTLTNALITNVMLMEHVPIPMALNAVLVLMVTLVTDSHVKTSTNVTLVYVVTTLLAQISQVASHAPALMVSRVM